MSVDATKIKVGDQILLRSRDVETVTKVNHRDDDMFPVSVFLGTSYGMVAYTRDGFYWDDREEDYRDILEIIPAETSEETTDDAVDAMPNPCLEVKSRGWSPSRDDKKVNLFEAEVGDTVIHKDGSKGTIKEIMKVQMLSGYDIALDIDHEDGRNTRLNYMQNGGGITHDSSQYIVRVVKPVKEEPAQDEMALRDQFAMSALNGLLSNHQCAAFSFSFDPESVAKQSYNIADKMMKAR